MLEFHLNHAIAADWFDACSLFAPPVTEIMRLRPADLVYIGDNRLTTAYESSDALGSVVRACMLSVDSGQAGWADASPGGATASLHRRSRC